MPQSSRESSAAPLVLTVIFEPGAQAYFEALRTQHFPPERNLVPAHLTLFHALPGDEEGSILGMLRPMSSEPEMRLEVTSLMRLGRGVAFRIDGARLCTMHAGLQRLWWSWLTQQDRQGFRPHIVIQNKAEPAAAKCLYTELASVFRPFSCIAAGLVLWRYVGGPWEWVETVPFAG